MSVRDSAPGGLLAADIGGTNARFAWIGNDGIPGPVIQYATADFPSPEEAISAVIADSKQEPRRVGLAAAGPVDDGVCKLTNADWHIDTRSLQRHFGLDRVVLLNDMEAVALALPHLPAEDLCHLAGPTEAKGPRLAIGLGTGVGTAVLAADSAVLAAEGGHVSWASLDLEEATLLARIAGEQDYLAAETVLGGTGLSRLYAALNETAPRLTSEQVFDRRNTDPDAAHAITLLTRMLGRFSGDAVLMTGARGGLYFAGGILTAWGDAFDIAAFREAFLNKGRFRSYLEQVPIKLITGTDPAILGVGALLHNH